MYVYSDCEKISSNEVKENTSKNINFFCSKNVNSTISNLTNSLNKKKEFLTKLNEKDFCYNPKCDNFVDKNLKSNSELFKYHKYENYSNWVHNIRLSISPHENKKLEDSKKKFYHELHTNSEKNIANNCTHNKSSNTQIIKEKKKYSNTLLDYKDEHRNFEEKITFSSSNKDLKVLDEPIFWEYDETIKDKESKMIFRKIFDKKLVDHLKLDSKSIKEKNFKHYKKVEENDKLKYINDKIGKMKRKILLMKGVFDFAYPKMITQKFKVVKNKAESALKNCLSSPNKSILIDCQSDTQGLNIIKLSQSTSKSKIREKGQFTTGFEYFTKTTQKRRNFYQKTKDVNSMPRITVVSPFRIKTIPLETII